MFYLAIELSKPDPNSLLPEDRNSEYSNLIILLPVAQWLKVTDCTSMLIMFNS